MDQDQVCLWCNSHRTPSAPASRGNAENMSAVRSSTRIEIGRVITERRVGVRRVQGAVDRVSGVDDSITVRSRRTGPGWATLVPKRQNTSLAIHLSKIWMS